MHKDHFGLIDMGIDLRQYPGSQMKKNIEQELGTRKCGAARSLRTIAEIPVPGISHKS